MAEQRMTPERRAEIEDIVARYQRWTRGNLDDSWFVGRSKGILLYTPSLLSELRAVEAENRTLRDAAAEALGYLTQLRETSDAFSRMECASRAHAVLDGALARAGGGADAAV